MDQPADGRDLDRQLRPGRPTPFVRRHPEALAAGRGETIGFSVRTGGEGPFTYQWRKDGVDLIDDGRMTGCTTENLRIMQVLAGDQADYSVVITGTCGEDISRSARLNITLSSDPHNE